MKRPRFRLVSAYGFLLLLAMGCEPLTVSLPTPPTAKRASAQLPFDAAATGTITGRVEWSGDVPDIPPIHAYRPIVNNGGLASAVVFLRTVRTAKAWDHPAVTAVLSDEALTIEQGDTRSPVGFVPVGEPVTFITKTQKIGGIHARGDAFFTQMFPQKAGPSTRSFPQAGRVTLSSASRQDWANAMLFVCEHPYYSRTDADGRFTLTGVPAGSYELVVWHGHYGISQVDRDPETGGIARRIYEKPIERSETISVEIGQTIQKSIAFTMADFTTRTADRR